MTKPTALLEAQHKKVKAALKKLESSPSRELMIEIANDLAAHMHIEQTLYYPVARGVKPDLVLESFEEHAVAEFELKRLLATDTRDKSLPARATTLRELLEHHIEEEEEDLFPAVDKALSAEELKELGGRMEETFDRAVADGYQALLPKDPARTSSDADKADGARRRLRHAATSV